MGRLGDGLLLTQNALGRATERSKAFDHFFGHISVFKVSGGA